LSIFLDVLPITVKNIAKDFEMVYAILGELDKFDLRLVYGDSLRWMRLFSWILLLPLSIRCIGSMRTSWGMLILFIVRLLVFRHVSGAYLVILRKGDNKKGEEDGMIIAFLVGLMLGLLLFWLRRGGGVLRMLFVR